MITILTNNNFRKEVIENTQLVLVEFGKDWSGSCQIMAPIIEQLHNDFYGLIKIGWLNIETYPQTATTYRIKELPTLLFFKDGKIIDQITGIVPRQVIIAKLQDLLK